MKPAEFPALLQQLWNDLHDVQALWQLAILAVALAAAGWGNRLIRPKIDGQGENPNFTVGGLQRLQFPVMALIVVLIGRAVLKHWHAVNLLNVAVPLLTALAITRIAVYALRRVFAPSGWLLTSERFIVGTVWLGFAAHITGLAPDILDFLDDIGFSVGKQRISLLLVLQGVISVSATLLMAMWLGRAVESRLMSAQTLDINLRVMFSKLAQALLVLVAILIALPAVGLDLTMFSIFGGAVGVGLGFGLQKIASNYVSGFIILMDRSVSIGDVITVDKYSGELTKMTARYVVVRGLDGTETLIPNETLVTSPVVNISYSDRRLAVAVPLQIGYRSDLRLAMKLMKQAAAGHSRVLSTPAPDVAIRQFGASGIDLDLTAWIEDPQRGQGNLRSDLYAAIWDAFQANGIEIPYPQQEIRILSGTPPQAS